MDEKLLHNLRCPECLSELRSAEERGLLCTGCGQEYPVTNNTPVLMSVSTRQVIEGNLSSWQENQALPAFMSHSLAMALASPKPCKWLGEKKKLTEILSWLDEDGLYINIGSGPDRFHPWVHNLDITASGNVDVACDAHKLPYADESVDGAFIMLFLEHVSDPQTICKEIHRVLKKDGFVFATAPFLQVHHANPRNYFRFTRDGVEELFGRFKDTQVQVAAGPSATLIWILKEYFAQMFPFSGNNFIYASVREILGWILYLLILLDYYLVSRPRSFNWPAISTFSAGNKR